MKVIILTKPEYTDSLYEIVLPYFDGNLIFIYDGKRPFPFDEWAGIGYEIGISFMYTHRVPAKEVNTHTWFNFHPAPLPEYRGRDLCYHAIMSGATEFGTTFHYMDENFDTGCIIDCFKFKILDTDNAESLSEFAIKQCKGQFKSYFPEIIAGKKFECTPNVGGTYFKKGNILAEVPIRPADPFGLWVRAVTYKDFAPRIDIGGRKYKIVRDE